MLGPRSQQDRSQSRAGTEQDCAGWVDCDSQKDQCQSVCGGRKQSFSLEKGEEPALASVPSAQGARKVEKPGGGKACVIKHGTCDPQTLVGDGVCPLFSSREPLKV